MAKEKEEKKEKKEKKDKKTKKEKVEKTEKVEKKKSKKPLIIIIVILSILVLSLLGVVGYFVYRNSLENKTTGSSWSDLYYDYLKEQKKSTDKNDPLNRKSSISFVQTKSLKDPMMIVKSKYTSDGKKYDYIAVYGIIDKKVRFLSGYSADKTDVKLYYDIAKDDYKYYIDYRSMDLNTYISLDTIYYDFDNYNLTEELNKNGLTEGEEYDKFVRDFYDKKSKDPNRDEININDSENKVVQKTLDGKELEYNKIDEIIIDTGVEPKYFDYDRNMDNINIREEIVDGRDDYKDIDDLLNKAIKKIVKEQIDLVNQVKQDIEKAKAEIQAEEERKAKEAEAALYAKGLTVGSHNLKFGNYTTSVPDGGIDGVPLYGTITLNPNGKFHIKTNFEQSSGELRSIDEDGTYTVGTAINSFDEQDAIKFTTNSGYRFTYFVTDNYMNSQWIIYKYSGS